MTKTTTRPATWVAPYRDDEPRPLVRMAAPSTADLLPPAATAIVEVQTSAVDRAKGFQIATAPVAAAFGVGALIVAAAGWAVPMFSITALAVFWCAFLAWWLVGWIVHNLASADGIALVHTLLGWQYLRREQRERHRRYYE